MPSSSWRPDLTLAEYEIWYDQELAWLDRQVNRIFVEVLGPTGWLEHTTFVLVGSYGLGFGESDRLVASGTLSDVDLHVPLLIQPAPDLGIETGQTIGATVSLLDLAPTLLDLYDLPG